MAVTVVAAIALALAGWLLLRLLSQSLTHNDDMASRRWAYDLSALAARGEVPAAIPPHGDDDIAQVVAANGTLIGTTHTVAPVVRVASFAPKNSGVA